MTDGDESCDTQTDAVNAAADLYNNGVTIGGKTWKVPTYVINFAGGSVANTNQIAVAGGTTAFAALGDIVILRRNDNGQQQSLPFRYADVARGRNLQQNIMLQAGDVVVVP